MSAVEFTLRLEGQSTDESKEATDVEEEAAKRIKLNASAHQSRQHKGKWLKYPFSVWSCCHTSELHCPILLSMSIDTLEQRTRSSPPRAAEGVLVDSSGGSSSSTPSVFRKQRLGTAAASKQQQQRRSNSSVDQAALLAARAEAFALDNQRDEILMRRVQAPPLELDATSRTKKQQQQRSSRSIQSEVYKAASGKAQHNSAFEQALGSIALQLNGRQPQQQQQQEKQQRMQWIPEKQKKYFTIRSSRSYDADDVMKSMRSHAVALSSAAVRDSDAYIGSLRQQLPTAVSATTAAATQSTLAFTPPVNSSSSSNSSSFLSPIEHTTTVTSTPSQWQSSAAINASAAAELEQLEEEKRNYESRILGALQQDIAKLRESSAHREQLLEAQVMLQHDSIASLQQSLVQQQHQYQHRQQYQQQQQQPQLPSLSPPSRTSMTQQSMFSTASSSFQQSQDASAYSREEVQNILQQQQLRSRSAFEHAMSLLQKELADVRLYSAQRESTLTAHINAQSDAIRSLQSSLQSTTDSLIDQLHSEISNPLIPLLSPPPPLPSPPFTTIATAAAAVAREEKVPMRGRTMQRRVNTSLSHSVPADSRRLKIRMESSSSKRQRQLQSTPMQHAQPWLPANPPTSSSHNHRASSRAVVSSSPVGRSKYKSREDEEVSNTEGYRGSCSVCSENDRSNFEIPLRRSPKGGSGSNRSSSKAASSTVHHDDWSISVRRPQANLENLLHQAKKQLADERTLSLPLPMLPTLLQQQSQVKSTPSRSSGNGIISGSGGIKRITMTQSPNPVLPRNDQNLLAPDAFDLPAPAVTSPPLQTPVPAVYAITASSKLQLTAPTDQNSSSSKNNSSNSSSKPAAEWETCTFSVPADAAASKELRPSPAAARTSANNPMIPGSNGDCWKHLPASPENIGGAFALLTPLRFEEDAALLQQRQATDPHYSAVNRSAVFASVQFTSVDLLGARYGGGNSNSSVAAARDATPKVAEDVDAAITSTAATAEIKQAAGAVNGPWVPPNALYHTSLHRNSLPPANTAAKAATIVATIDDGGVGGGGKIAADTAVVAAQNERSKSPSFASKRAAVQQKKQQIEKDKKKQQREAQRLLRVQQELAAAAFAPREDDGLFPYLDDPRSSLSPYHRITKHRPRLLQQQQQTLGISSASGAAATITSPLKSTATLAARSPAAAGGGGFRLAADSVPVSPSFAVNSPASAAAAFTTTEPSSKTSVDAATAATESWWEQALHTQQQQQSFDGRDMEDWIQ